MGGAEEVTRDVLGVAVMRVLIVNFSTSRPSSPPAHLGGAAAAGNHSSEHPSLPRVPLPCVCMLKPLHRSTEHGRWPPQASTGRASARSNKHITAMPPVMPPPCCPHLPKLPATPLTIQISPAPCTARTGPVRRADGGFQWNAVHFQQACMGWQSGRAAVQRAGLRPSPLPPRQSARPSTSRPANHSPLPCWSPKPAHSCRRACTSKHVRLALVHKHSCVATHGGMCANVHAFIGMGRGGQ